MNGGHCLEMGIIMSYEGAGRLSTCEKLWDLPWREWLIVSSLRKDIVSRSHCTREGALLSGNRCHVANNEVRSPSDWWRIVCRR